MRSAERSIARAAAPLRAALALALALLLAACAGVRGDGADAGAPSAPKPANGAATAPGQKPLIPDLDNTVIDTFEGGSNTCMTAICRKRKRPFSP